MTRVTQGGKREARGTNSAIDTLLAVDDGGGVRGVEKETDEKSASYEEDRIRKGIEVSPITSAETADGKDLQSGTDEDGLSEDDMSDGAIWGEHTYIFNQSVTPGASVGKDIFSSSFQHAATLKKEDLLSHLLDNGIEALTARVPMTKYANLSSPRSASDPRQPIDFDKLVNGDLVDHHFPVGEDEYRPFHDGVPSPWSQPQDMGRGSDSLGDPAYDESWKKSAWKESAFPGEHEAGMRSHVPGSGVLAGLHLRQASLCMCLATFLVSVGV